MTINSNSYIKIAAVEECEFWKYVHVHDLVQIRDFDVWLSQYGDTYELVFTSKNLQIFTMFKMRFQ